MRYIDAKTWVRTWQEAGPRLDAIRRRELEQVDVAAFIQVTADAFDASCRGVPTRPSSGLVDQQRLFAHLAG